MKIPRYACVWHEQSSGHDGISARFSRHEERTDAQRKADELRARGKSVVGVVDLHVKPTGRFETLSDSEILRARRTPPMPAGSGRGPAFRATLAEV